MIDYTYLTNLMFWLLFSWGEPVPVEEDKFRPEQKQLDNRAELVVDKNNERTRRASD